MKSLLMNIHNLNHQMSFICSDEAGKFMAFLADKEVCGAITVLLAEQSLWEKLFDM